MRLRPRMVYEAFARPYNITIIDRYRTQMAAAASHRILLEYGIADPLTYVQQLRRFRRLTRVTFQK